MNISDKIDPRDLAVVPQRVVDRALEGALKECKAIVEKVYVDAANDQLVNPDSLFLRPDMEGRERIIALPAYVPGDVSAMGVKWISSFPENISLDLPRASALIVLNDLRTGFPVAVLEGARISAYRTALSALVGAETLLGRDRSAAKVAVVGTGYISQTTLRVMADEAWSFGSLSVHDIDPSRARAFADRVPAHLAAEVSMADDAGQAVAGADLVLLATTATVPHIADIGASKSDAVVLHMSLRDLTPEAMTGATQVVDHVAHALREKTSLALAVDQGTVQQQEIQVIGDFLQGRVERDRGRRAIYSPFGLGSLDIAVAQLVLDRSRGAEDVTVIPGFSSS
ncbi:hypothetical protein AAW14_20930 [Streptomyces hygroscopicus]|uniref:2,3-diaminopropionate biosynthesis protein SbnB n=1 Tax=Streptomyces hygroscopicus TaxID=1912 RepID=UPI00223F8B5A|nr:2,3-diaminopropionate biosynthesis protein SbnB [Streptomyces hygroscopicus]MCW7944418.1 hypothetical protein [Streptomyces hygroscopicus]